MVPSSVDEYHQNLLRFPFPAYLTIIPRARVGYEMVVGQRGA